MKGKALLPVIFVLLFALSRIPGLLPHNFSAAYALVFCAGVYFTGRMAWWLLLGVMLTTDVGLNFYYWLRGVPDIWAPGNLRLQFFNYFSYAAIILLGRRFKPQSSFLSLLGGGILGVILFYLITNTIAWLVNPTQAPEYTRDLWGWLIALTKGTNGWPETWQFFRNSLLSGGMFTAFFVGAMKLTASTESPQDKEAGAAAPAEPEPEETPEEAGA